MRVQQLGTEEVVMIGNLMLLFATAWYCMDACYPLCTLSLVYTYYTTLVSTAVKAAYRIVTGEIDSDKLYGIHQIDIWTSCS